MYGRNFEKKKKRWIIIILHLFVAALCLSGCKENLSYNDLSDMANDLGGNPASGIVNEVADGAQTPSGALDGGAIMKGMLQGISEQVASVYVVAHRYVLLVIILSWLIMLVKIILEHKSESKLKIAIVGFGIVIPFAVVVLDIGCGLYLSWSAAGGLPASEDNVFLAAAAGIAACTPVLAVMAVIILALGIVYLLLGKKGKIAWRSFGFSLLIDIVLILLMVGSRMAIS